MGAFGEYLGSKEISEEKKEIFSRQMMKILNYGGMMGFEAVRLYGHEMGLLKPVEIFSRENIHFHYNYFEDNVWETAGFKIDSCDLWSEKIGMAEFSDVIMAGYMLYEAYSEDGGMAVIDGEIIDSTDYMGWINHILGTSFSMKNRFNLWKNAENFALSRIRSGYDEFLSKQMFSKIIPKELKYAAGGTELADLLYIIHGTSTLIEEEKEMKQGTYSADILKCRQLLEKYFENNIDNPIEELWNFLKKEFGIREKESDDRMKEIADMSLRIPARVFVYLAVEINGNMEFWKEWKELKDVVYQDEKVTDIQSLGVYFKEQFNGRVPVSCVGGLTTPEQIEYLIEKEYIDTVDVARAILADPEFANAVLEHKEYTKCFGCQACQYGPFTQHKCPAEMVRLRK